MREPPPDVDHRDLLATVQGEWDAGVERLDHLPVGFGAHHWAAYDASGPVLFVTLDRLGLQRRTEDLAAAYAGAVALERLGLEFVLAPLPGHSGSVIVETAGGALSCTPWRDGTSGGELDVRWTAAALTRLHAVVPPDRVPRWQPLVTPAFAAEVEATLARRWGPGPYAERARDAVAARASEIAEWTRRYHALAALARTRTWVVTHGEPHADNQLLTPQGRYLVDWESLKLAPPERDLRALVDTGVEHGGEPEMLELFDLEWRLDEISEYVAWFAAEHSGTEDDRIAFADLLHELTRA